ncbi:MAG: hypothetical protein GSR74_01970 [Desulfurococcales archaeon]|nr:hypothetical protein [Desulfurococcales archaeon]
MVETLCEICNTKPAVAQCRLCGRQVCEDHIDDQGICTICREALCQICGQRLAIGYCIICGRLGCDQCLVQVDSVRRVCRDCLRRLGGRNKIARILRRPTLKIA